MNVDPPAARCAYLGSILRAVSTLHQPERDLHVTLMCSRRAPDGRALQELRSHMSGPCEARLVRLAWMAGHDKQGYLVAELESMDVVDRHDLLTKVGCIPQWPSFYPHITLVKAVSRSVALAYLTRFNPMLAGGGYKVRLSGVTCRDLHRSFA